MAKGIGEKLYLAPIEGDKLHRILDIGTGTGICTTPALASLCSVVIREV